MGWRVEGFGGWFLAGRAARDVKRDLFCDAGPQPHRHLPSNARECYSTYDGGPYTEGVQKGLEIKDLRSLPNKRETCPANAVSQPI